MRVFLIHIIDDTWHKCHQSRLHDDVELGPSSAFAHKQENIVSAGQENRSRASCKHLF